VDDLKTTIFHPAMLDMATGGAQLLIDDFDQATEFFVPFSYGKICSFQRFPQQIVSHIRFLGRHGDTASFDVVLADKHGTIVSTIDSFLMKRVGQEQFSQTDVKVPIEVPEQESTLMRSLLSQGTTAEEGMDVLARVLFHRAGPQVFATPVDMHDWIRQTDATGAEAEKESLSFSLGADREREEPKTLLEQELLAIWSELLGVDGLGVLDDFFEMGGQSLVAARMFVRIRKNYGITLPLSALFASPTIRALAEQIDPTGSYDQAPSSQVGRGDSKEAAPTRPEFNSSPENWSPVVAIQPAGSLPPFFCAPGMGGNPLGQRFLAERLGRNQPFYGLQARGVDGGQEPHTSVEEMAAEYIRAIKKIQPQGPYFLGGFSGGGVVSYEMAQQLTASGDQIGLLALLDAYNPLLPHSSSAYRLRAQVARSREKGIEHFAEVVKWKVIFPLQRAGAFDRLKGTTRVEGHQAGFETERAALDHKMMSSWIAAERRYRPQPYHGDALLFRSRWDLLRGRTDVLPDPENGWNTLVQGRLTVLDVPGTHDSFLLEPNVRHVAQGLSEQLKRAHSS
jgi:thioesterase domain-containing protein/acyl carrier protein